MQTDRHCRNFRGGGRCQGVAAVVSLFSSSRRSHLWDREEEERETGGVGRRGGGWWREQEGRGGGWGVRWAGGHLRGSGSHARRLCLYTVRSRLPACSLPASSRFIVLQVGSPAGDRSTGAERTVCGSAGAGDPAPRPTRRASAGTHPPQRLSPPATPRSSPTSRRHQSAGKGEATFLSWVTPLSRPLRQFVSGDAAGRRHLLESSVGVGSAATLRCHLGDTTLRQDPWPSGSRPRDGIMKHSVAAWLLLGLSLSVPQFCRGEAKGQGLAAGTGGGSPWETPWRSWRRSRGRARSGEPCGWPGGGCAPYPGCPGKVLCKVRAECWWGWAGKGVWVTQMRSRKDGEEGEKFCLAHSRQANPPRALWVMPDAGARRGFRWGAREARSPRAGVE